MSGFQDNDGMIEDGLNLGGRMGIDDLTDMYDDETPVDIGAILTDWELLKFGSKYR